MKYALINGEKTEATKSAKGVCPSCDSELISKCGDLKIHHWSHKGSRNCDQWWENETEWHRAWKGNFLKEWQEVVHFDETGEKHIADIKTKNGWVIEFQYSFLKNLERQCRNAFYEKLVWVVNGTRRKNDKIQFLKRLSECTRLSTKFPIFRLSFPEECRIIKEWNDNSLVFFDFKGAEYPENEDLWFLFPNIQSSSVYMSPIPRDFFITLFKNDSFDEFHLRTITPICNEIANGERGLQQANRYNLANPLTGFDKHLRKIQRGKQRF